MPYYRAVPSPKGDFHQLALLTIIAFVTLVGAGCVPAQQQPAPAAPVVPAEQPSTPVVPQATTATTTPAAVAPAPVPADNTTASSQFKDGVYTAHGAYQSPAGAESVKVTVTLKNDVVVDAAVQGEATAKFSQRMQGEFINNFKPLVIGKKITDIHLTKVSGSSLTPAGFNAALAMIETQATK